MNYNMKVTNTKIPAVKIIEPTVFEDERGFFFESFNQKQFQTVIGHKINFVQDNQSYSKKGILRGLHYQLPPYAQGKLVRVINGEIFDVAIDIRKSSTTFGNWVSKTLSSKNKKQIWIPEGFAHGFITISEEAEVLYKTTNYYSKKHERSIIWNDNELNISWPQSSEILLSHKDAMANTFNSAELFS